jgi:hypothetical protein
MKYITCSILMIALGCGLSYGAQNTGQSTTTEQQQDKGRSEKREQKDKDAAKLQGQASGVRCARIQKKGGKQ